MNWMTPQPSVVRLPDSQLGRMRAISRYQTRTAGTFRRERSISLRNVPASIDSEAEPGIAWQRAASRTIIREQDLALGIGGEECCQGVVEGTELLIDLGGPGPAVARQPRERARQRPRLLDESLLIETGGRDEARQL